MGDMASVNTPQLLAQRTDLPLPDLVGEQNLCAKVIKMGYGISWNVRYRELDISNIRYGVGLLTP